MRIALSVTLDIDPEVWANEYGLDADRPGGLARAVRDDVRAHVANTMHEHYVTDLGIARETVVKAPSSHRSSRLFS